MNLQKIEDEALHLPKQERAQLIQRLVLSLKSPSKEELRFDWLLEARRRGEELDKGTVQAVSGDDVMRKARALTKCTTLFTRQRKPSSWNQLVITNQKLRDWEVSS